jgi:hypothetical protein
VTQCGRLLRRRGKSSRSGWKGPICWYVADVPYNGLTILRFPPIVGARAPRCRAPLSHPPAAARYAKLTTRASSGKSRRANVVLPAPFGPAITMDRGCPLSFVILQQHTRTSVKPGEGLNGHRQRSGCSSVREGIEPPTRGFSARCRVFQGFINQSLAASCRPLPRHTKAQSWHTQSELVTFLAQARRRSAGN